MTGGPRIAVVDYGAGNLVSIEQALTSVGATVALVGDAEALDGCDAVIVPGVGAAGPAMERLDQAGWARGLPATCARSPGTGGRPAAARPCR